MSHHVFPIFFRDKARPTLKQSVCKERNRKCKSERERRGLLPFSLPSYFPSHHRLWHYRYFPPGLQRWEENFGNYKVTKFCRSKGFSRSWFRSKRTSCCPIIKSVYVFVLHLSSSDLGYWTSSTDPRVIMIFSSALLGYKLPNFCPSCCRNASSVSASISAQILKWWVCSLVFCC